MDNFKNETEYVTEKSAMDFFKAQRGTIVNTGDFIELWDKDLKKTIAQYDKRDNILYSDLIFKQEN